MLRDGKSGVPVTASLQVGLELRNTVRLRRLDFPVRIESGGICGDVDGVRAVQIGGSQWQGRGVTYADVQECRRREDAVFAGGVCDRVPAGDVLALAATKLGNFRGHLEPLHIPHNLAHLDAARLVEQQHSARALFLDTELLLRRCEQEIRGPRARVGLGEGVGARSEQHLAASSNNFRQQAALTITGPRGASSAGLAARGRFWNARMFGGAALRRWRGVRGVI